MDQQFLLAAAAALALAVMLGVLLGRYAWPSRPIDAGALAQLQQDLARHQQDGEELRERTRSLAAERVQIEERAGLADRECAMLTERVTHFDRTVAEQAEQIRNAAAAREEATRQARDAAVEIARLSDREKVLAEKIDSQVVQLAALQTQLTTEFENIAHRVLNRSATQLSETSNQSLSALLDPLKEKIGDFQRKVEQTYETEQREVISLKEQIKSAIETSQNVGKQADDLAKALRGNSQQLGRWGELVLERVLEDAGLKEGREYVTQGRGLQLKNDDGGAVRPDVIVNLPEGRTLIIDSKVPLAAYERLITTADDNERSICRGLFIRDVKGHIDDLAGKRYQENQKLQAHDCALLFVPIEGALHEALKIDSELFTYAWSKNVVLVGPPTLLMTMRTVQSIWRYELQTKHAQQIAKLAGDLCDKLSSSLEDFNRVTGKLNEAVEAHNGALKRLSFGRGNALSIGARIRGLGVKTNRRIPDLMIDGVPVSALNGDEEGSAETGDATAPDDGSGFAESLLDNDRAVVSESN